MLIFNHVSKTYVKTKSPAVDGLDLHVKRGEIFGFIGPNGAGKTTAIKMLTGVLTPSEGTISIGGYDIKTDPIKAKKLIGFVPDAHELYDRLTGMEYLSFIGDMYGTPEETRKTNIAKYLHMFSLEKAANDPIKSYSRGMRQKLILTSALMNNPPLWVMDEPMVGLDPRAAALLKDEMRAHCARGNTVFFSTHVLEVAEKLCDRIGIIDDGKLLAVGTLEELSLGAAGSLEHIFLKLTESKEGEADATA